MYYDVRDAMLLKIDCQDQNTHGLFHGRYSFWLWSMYFEPICFSPLPPSTTLVLTTDISHLGHYLLSNLLQFCLFQSLLPAWSELSFQTWIMPLFAFYPLMTSYSPVYWGSSLAKLYSLISNHSLPLLMFPPHWHPFGYCVARFFPASEILSISFSVCAQITQHTLVHPQVEYKLCPQRKTFLEHKVCLVILHTDIPCFFFKLLVTYLYFSFLLVYCVIPTKLIPWVHILSLLCLVIIPCI